MKCRLVSFGLLCGLAILSQLAAQEQEKDKKEPKFDLPGYWSVT